MALSNNKMKREEGSLSAHNSATEARTCFLVEWGWPNVLALPSAGAGRMSSEAYRAGMEELFHLQDKDRAMRYLMQRL